MVKINFFNSSGAYNPNVFASFILSMTSGTGFNCTLSGDGIVNQTQSSTNLLFGGQWTTEGSYNVRIDCYNELSRDFKTLVQIIQTNISGLAFVNLGGASSEPVQLQFFWLSGSNITFLLLVNHISYSLTTNETKRTGISQNINISSPGVLTGVLRATNLISDIILVANLTFSQRISNVNLIPDKYYKTNGSAFNFYLNMSTGSGVQSVIFYGDGNNYTNTDYTSPSVYWPGISLPYTYSNVGTYNVTVNFSNVANSQISSTVVYVLTSLGTYEIVYNNLFFKKNDIIQLSLNRTSGYPASMTNITINWQNGDITSVPFTAFNESAIYNYQYSVNGAYNVTITLQNPLSTVVKSILLSIIDPIVNFRCVSIPANTWNGNQLQFQTLSDLGQNVIYTLNPGDGGALMTKNINITAPNTQYNFNYTYNTVGNYTANIWACNQIGCQNCSNYVQIQYKIQSFDFQVTTNGNIEFLKTNLITTISFNGTNFPTALKATFTLSDGSPPVIIYLTSSMMPYNFVTNVSAVGFGSILVKLENLANSVNFSATYGSFQKFSNFNVSLTWGPTRALGFGANYNTFPLNNPIYFRPSAQATGTVVGYIFLYAPLKNTSAIFQCNATLVNGEFSYTFSTMGDFNVSFKVYNPIDQAFIERTLTIGSSIQNTQISTRPLTLIPNYFGYVYIQWSVISTESCICVDFANNTKLIYGATSGCFNCSGSYTNKKPINNLLDILVRFTNEGDYNIKVFIYNDYESAYVNRTIPVTYSQCAPPVVSMTYSQYQNPITPQKDIRSSQIIVSAVVIELPCTVTKNNVKLWFATLMDPIYLTPIKFIDLSLIPTSNNTQLIIPPRYLEYGLYKLTFGVTMDKNVTVYTFQSSNFTYLYIDKSPIIVGLSSGGISLIVNGIDQNICFTPLVYSQDPDLNVQDFSKWTWSWTCQQMKESANFTNYVYPKPIGYSFTTPKTGCFGDGPGVVNFTTSPCFWGGNLDINGTYQLGLIGMTPDNRTGAAKIIMTVVQGIPPNITVQCLRPLMCKINNEGDFAYNEVVFNPSDALLLTATCYINGTICNQGLWTMILLNDTTQIWTPLNATIANLYIRGIYSMQISLLPSFFAYYNAIQRFQICYNSVNLTTNGKSCIQFYIFPLPSGIICTLDKTIVQQTDIVCVNCTFKPNYQYRMFVNVTNECTTLGFNSTGQFCSIIPYQTVNQTYIVRVTNINGGFIDVIAGIIMVTQLKLTDLTNILTSVINGTDTTLTVAIAKGDFKEMSQVYLKYVSVLTASNQITIRTLTNNSKENLGGTGYLTKSVDSSTMTIESLPKNIRDKYEFDRDQKSTVINSMTAGLYTMVPGDIQSLHLISSVVNAIGESADCINRLSQWQLSTKLRSLADNFKELQKTAPRDDVLTIATNLLSANYRSDAAANIQIDNGILRDIKFSKDTYLDYDTNLESSAKMYMNVDDPNAAAYSLTLETNSNYQSKIAFGVGSNSFYTIQTVSKVLRDITVLNDVPTDLLTSQMQYYSIKTQLNDLSNKAFTKGRSTVILPDICAAFNSPAASCSDPNNPIGLEIIATPNNVRAYAQNSNNNGLPIPMNSDFISLSLFLGNQNSESPVQPNGKNNFTIFITRDPVFAVADFNFSEPDPQIQPAKSIPGTGSLFSGPKCFEQKLVLYQFTLQGNDQSVHFQIKSNFSNNCTQYLIVGRLGKPPVLGESPDGSVDSENFTFWGTIPTHTKYCNLIPSSNEPDPFTFFVDNNMFKQSKISTKNSMPDYSKTLNTLYFGVRQLTPAEYNIYTQSNRPPVPYTISAQINNTFRVRIFSTGCYFNSNNFQGGWGTDGCVVGPLTTTKVTQCICNHLTSFASGWIVAPNTIDFDYVFSNFDFTKNLTLFVTEIVVVLVFIVIFIWARRMDIKDIEKVGVTPLPSNDTNDMYLYEVTVDTSIRANAGTSSNVYFILSGEQDETYPRHLVDTKRPILKRGNVDRFLLAVPRSLGVLQYIRLWHDNSGKGKDASWYCNYFGVTDLQTKEKFHFLVNSWFAVEENDGQIDRLIAVASVDELLHFEEVFSRKMKLNLSEDHLWLSIMARPPESRFTRVERVACCLLLLFLTMLTTCMFYQTEGPTKTTENVLTVGPFALTAKEIWIGIITNIISFVPLFLIIELFRRSQLKHGHANKLRQAVENHLQISLESKENLGHQGSMATLVKNEEENSRPTTPAYRSTDQINIQIPEYDSENQECDANDKYKKRVLKRKLLPWWMRIVVWGFLTFLVIVSVVFTTFYGIQFGDLACKKWISSMFISFFTSVLLTQPIKVILLAIFFALVCKKSSSFNNAEYINEEEELMNELGRKHALNQNEEFLHNELYTAPIKPHRFVIQPPPKEELEKAREVRLKELQMYDVFREIVFYIIFFCTLLFVTYSFRDPNAYQLKNELTNIFIKTANPNWQFTGITREDQFWTWALNILVPNLRAPVWYNNDPQIYQRGFISNRNNRLIGYAIMRQVRAKKDSCKVFDYVKTIAKNCYSSYNIFNQDEGNYGAGWTTLAANDTPVPEFSFKSQNELNSMSYVGRIGFYSGGGYVYQFRSNVSNLFTEMNALKDSHWIDFQTRAIFVEFTTYNPNINLFAINTFVVEMPGSGGMWTIYRVEPANLLGLYSGGVKAFEIFCQVLYGIFILVIIVKEIRNIIKQKWNYFTQFWNLIEVFIVIGSFIAVAGFAYVQIETNKLTTKFAKYGGNIYLNFANVAFCNENLGYMVSFIVFLATLKFIKILRFNRRIGMLGSVLSYTSKDIKQFFIIFTIMFLAFVMVFYSLFMDSLYRYHTFLFATEASMQIALGKFAFLELYQKEPIFGPIVFAGYVLFIIFVLLNMFIAILYDGFAVVKADIELQDNDHELVKFVLTKFVMWTGISETKFGKKFIKTGITDQIYKDIDTRQLADKIDEFPEKIEQFLNHINKIIYEGKKGHQMKDKTFSSILFDQSNLNNKYDDKTSVQTRPTSAVSNILKSKANPEMTPIDK